MHHLRSSLWLAVAAALLLAACGHPCDSTTCFGCCDAAGECQTPQVDHCGLNGAACQSCLDSQTCAVGVCQQGTGELTTSGAGGPSGGSGGSMSGSSGAAGSTGGTSSQTSQQTSVAGSTAGAAGGPGSTGQGPSTGTVGAGASGGTSTGGARGTLTGAVYSLDPSMPVVGATLDIAGPSPEVVVVNSEDGSFSVSLVPGTYSLLASASGFANRPLQGIVVGAGSSSYVGIDLGEPLSTGASTSTASTSTASTASAGSTGGGASIGGSTLSSTARSSTGRGSSSGRSSGGKSSGARSTAASTSGAATTDSSGDSSGDSTGNSTGNSGTTSTTTGSTGASGGEGSGSLVGTHAFAVGSAMEFFTYLDGGAPDTSSVQFELIDAPTTCGDLAANGGHLPHSVSQILFGQVSNIIGFPLQGGSYTVPSQTLDTASLTYRHFFGDGGFADQVATSGNVQLQGPIEEGVLSGSFSVTLGDASGLVGQFSAFYCDPSAPN